MQSFGREGSVGVQVKKRDGVCLGAKDFEETINTLAGQTEPLQCNLGRNVKALIIHQVWVLCGLENGDVLKLSLAPSFTPTKFISNNPHTDSITCLIASDDACISGSLDNTLQVWDVQENTSTGVLEGHEDDILSVAFIPKTTQCISGSADKSVRVWDYKKCKQLKKIDATFKAFCFAVDATRKVLSGNDDGSISVWDLNQQREEKHITGHSSWINKLAVLGKQLCISASPDKSLRIWDYEQGKEVGVLLGHTDAITCFDFAPDGTCVSSSSDGTLRHWDLAKRREIGVLKGHSKGVKCVAITPDGRCVSGSEDKSVRVWDLQERVVLAKFRAHGEEVTFVVMSTDGKCISGSADRTTKMWDLDEPKEIVKVLVDPVNCCAMTEDGLNFLAMNDILVLWDLKTNTEMWRTVEKAKINCLSVSGSRLCAAGLQNGQISVWDMKSKAQEALLGEMNSPQVLSLSIGRNGKCVSWNGNKYLQTWELTKKITDCKFESDDIAHLLMSVDETFCVGAVGKFLRKWSVTYLNEPFSKEMGPGKITCLIGTFDGNCVLGNSDGAISLVELGELNVLMTFYGPHSPLKSICVDYAGRIALASADGTLSIWEPNERRIVSRAEKLPTVARAMHVSRYGKCSILLDNGGLLLWDWTRDAITGMLADTVSELESVPEHLRQCISSFKDGVLRPISVAKLSFGAFRFNSLHISANYNHHEKCDTYLRNGVQFFRGNYGSPISLALERKAIRCVDVFLSYFIELASERGNDSIWFEVSAMTDDLIPLLASSSTELVSFFGILMRTPTVPRLPDFISPTATLPMTKHISNRFIDVKDFDNSHELYRLVKFRISLPRWNLTAGSPSSIALLSAILQCEDKMIMISPYVSAIIEEKWNYFYAFTLSTTFAYILLLASMCSLLYIDWSSYFFIDCFLSLNTFFSLYEVAQLISTGREYLADYWNWLDIGRSSLSTAWAIFLLQGYSPVMSEDMKRLTLVVVILCFFRGFTYFRSFKMTRIYVYLTLAVVKEMYSFLVILGYSVFAFGIFSSVLLGIDSIGDAWADAYNLLMGNFDNSSYQAVEWVLFTGATLTNVVIMLNLLISILGEAYEKCQLSARENDLYQQLSLIWEYEYMMFWRRGNHSPGTVIVTCEDETDAREKLEWSGQILQITQTIQSALKYNFDNAEKEVTGLDRKVTGLDGKVTGLDGKVTGLDGKIAGLEGKIDGKIAGLEGKIDEKIAGLDGKIAGLDGKIAGLEGKIDEKIAGLDGKIAGMEDHLQAILGLLQAKS